MTRVCFSACAVCGSRKEPGLQRVGMTDLFALGNPNKLGRLVLIKVDRGLAR